MPWEKMVEPHSVPVLIFNPSVSTLMKPVLFLSAVVSMSLDGTKVLLVSNKMLV